MATSNHLQELLTQQTIIKDRVRACVHGQSNGMYIHGRPGTSKTYMVRSTLEIMAVDYSYANGHLTPIGLFDLIADNRDRIIVLDDIGSIFNAPIALQLLLAALGTPHDGSRTRKVRYKTAKGDQEIPFTGAIIGISNLPLAGHHKEILAALNDRANVIGYEPSDEQIVALIEHLAKNGVRGVPPDKAMMVANFLASECKLQGFRPSVRMFVDKALVDYQLWASNKSESHWKDLVASNLKQMTIELQHDTRDLSRTEQIEAERRIALGIMLEFSGRKERIEAWATRTSKGQSAFYRRLDELKKEGRLPDLNGNGNGSGDDDE